MQRPITMEEFDFAQSLFKANSALASTQPPHSCTPNLRHPASPCVTLRHPSSPSVTLLHPPLPSFTLTFTLNFTYWILPGRWQARSE